MSKWIVNILILFGFLVSCESEISLKHRAYSQNNSIVYERVNDKGQIEYKRRLNKDFIPKGEVVTFGENNRVKRWSWHDESTGLKYPYLICYYGNDGIYDSMRGTPFLGVFPTIGNQLAFELANPPSVLLEVEYRAYHKNKLTRKITFEPGRTDSTCWITLNSEELEFGNNCKFWLYYYILDENRQRIDSAVTEIDE